MKTRVLLAILVHLCVLSYSQTGVIQDDDGKTAIPFAPDSMLAIAINAADKSLTVTLSDADVTSSQNYYLGGELSLSGKDGKFPVFRNGEANFEFKASLTGYLLPDTSDVREFFYATLRSGVGRMSVFDSENYTLDKLYRTETSGTGLLQIGYTNEELTENIILGVAVQAGWGDNTQELDNYELRKVNFEVADTTGNSVVSSTSTEVYLKEEFRKGVFFIKPMLDVGYYIKNLRLLPMLHLRYDLYPDEAASRIFSPGAALYFTEQNNPGNAVIGLQLFLNDFTNEKKKDTSRWERAVVNLVVGYKF